MNLVWTDSAKRDLGGIITFIWFDSPAAAKRIRQRIETTARYLKSQPFMGKAGELPDTREVFSPPSFRTVYQVAEETVSFLRILHTSRQWPPASDDETP